MRSRVLIPPHATFPPEEDDHCGPSSTGGALACVRRERRLSEARTQRGRLADEMAQSRLNTPLSPAAKAWGR